MWFLPFLMIVTIPAAVAFRFGLRHPGSAAKIALISATIGTLWMYWPRRVCLNHVDAREMFFLHAWKALPSVFCGFAVALLISRIPKNENVLSTLAVVGFFLTWATIGNQVMYGYNLLDRTLSGLGWFLLAFAPIHGKLIQWLGKLGRHSFGMYRAHALFVEGMQYALHRMGLKVSPMMDLAVFCDRDHSFDNPLPDCQSPLDDRNADGRATKEASKTQKPCKISLQAASGSSGRLRRKVNHGSTFSSTAFSRQLRSLRHQTEIRSLRVSAPQIRQSAAR